ncbi:MAG: YlxR family protein [Acidimicrobiales bacterium]
MCVGCRRTAAPAELVRLSVGTDGTLLVGPGPGRGAWLCRSSPGCLEQAHRRQALSRALRGEVGPEAVRRLGDLLGSGVVPGQAGAQVCEDGGSGRFAGSPPNEREGP